jgi:transcription initiation factor IIF auxiliary subunit
MTLRIEQGFKYRGEELDQIDHVIYILHPTFPNPVREVKNRSTKFRLDTAGWGVFLIRATVKQKSGKEISLTHYLKLERD